jgi:hypothetical protein
VAPRLRHPLRPRGARARPTRRASRSLLTVPSCWRRWGNRSGAAALPASATSAVNTRTPRPNGCSSQSPHRAVSRVALVRVCVVGVRLLSLTVRKQHTLAATSLRWVGRPQRAVAGNPARILGLQGQKRAAHLVSRPPALDLQTESPWRTTRRQAPCAAGRREPPQLQTAPNRVHPRKGCSR